MIATIIGTSTYPPGSDLSIQGDSIIMGGNEAMTVYGNITLTAPSISLGDVVALEALTIDAGGGGTIDTNLRGTITILDHTGASVFSPNRHFLSGGPYSQTGNFNPVSPIPVVGQVPTLSFSDLTYNGMVLNFDTDQIPVPPVPPPPVIPTQPRMYLLGVASAQLFYSLPIYWQDFPPSYYLRQKVRLKWKEREREWRLKK